jgi:hypothetical protein
MDPHHLERLQRAFTIQATRYVTESPLYEAICVGLGAPPLPAVVDLFDRYYRIISSTHPDIPLLLAALHHLALTGGAPDLEALFPSCGGQFAAAAPAKLIRVVAEQFLESQEDILDFMLSQTPQSHEVALSSAVLLGALATVAQFGGGLSLVELGCAGGLALQFDRYAYQFGDQTLGGSPLSLHAAVTGRIAPLLAQGMPEVLARRGLDLQPLDLTQEAERLLLAAFVPPDQAERIARMNAAAALLRPNEPLDLRRGKADRDLTPLLLEAYLSMPPGNTLFLYNIMVWPDLSDEERAQLTYGVQKLASRIEPHKPIAWLQVEPFTAGSDLLEARLLTYGWVDPEDRTVRRLAHLDPTCSWIDWLI